jgi:hypothetical protein
MRNLFCYFRVFIFSAVIILVLIEISFVIIIVPNRNKILG